MAKVLPVFPIIPISDRGLPSISWHSPRRKEWSDGIPISPYHGNLHMITQGYRDDSFGDYGGTPDVALVNPIGFAAYLIQSNKYGNKSIVAPGAFGNFADARASLDQWATWGHRTGAKSWVSWAMQQEQEDIESVLVGLTNWLPGIRFTRNEAGAYRAFVWTPGASWPTSQRYASDVPIAIEEFLLSNSEGADIQIWQGDSSEVRNQVEVQYHFNAGSGKYERTAKLDRYGSDDGYSDAWGQWGGVSGANIAAWSHGTYGERRSKIELRETSDPDIAVAIGQYEFWSRYRPPVYLNMRTTMGLGDLLPGHIFRLSNTLESRLKMEPSFWGTASSGTYEHASWESVYWLCSYAHTDGTGGFRGRRILATWIPRTFGNEVSAGAGESGPVGDAGSLSEEF